MESEEKIMKIIGAQVVGKGGLHRFLLTRHHWKQSCLLYLPMATILLILTWTTSIQHSSSFCQSPALCPQLLPATAEDGQMNEHQATNKEQQRQQMNAQWQQLLRQQRLINHCRDNGAFKMQGAKKRTSSVRLITSRDKTVAYCHVPKAASTSWMVAFAQLNQVQDYQQLIERGLLHGELLNHFGIDYDQIDSDASNQTFTFTFIRHPFQRIVSAYIDKIVIRQEKNFLQPVIDWEAGLFGRLAATWNSKSGSILGTASPSSSEFHMHFEKFVKFVINEVEHNFKSYGSLHWWPYSKLCGFCSFKYDFIGKVETLSADIELLDQMQVFPLPLSMVMTQKFNRNGDDTDKLSRLYFKQLSKDLVMQLYHIYQDDFLIGGYEFPKEYLDVAKSN